MTARQFYFVLITFVVSLKIQKMPCLLYEFLGKDNYILYLIFLILDIVGVIVAFFLSRKLRIITENNLKGSVVLEFIIKVLAIFVSAYFLFQAILFYESIQDLFSHILFDNLSWKIFSIFLLFSIFFLASFKFETIGRVCEVFFSLIVISLIVLAIFGGLHTDFSEVLPLQTIFNHNYFEAFKKFNIWFGDFFLVLFLGVYAKDVKLKYTLISYVGSILFACLILIEFNGIYLVHTPMQPSVISVLSEQALLGIDIGRFDWFFILMSEFGTVIGASVCLCLSRRAISQTFPKLNKKIILLIFVLLIYLLDVFYLVDLYTKRVFFFEYASVFAMLVKNTAVGILLIKILYFKEDIKKFLEKEKISNKHNTLSIEEESVFNSEEDIQRFEEKHTNRKTSNNEGFIKKNANNLKNNEKSDKKSANKRNLIENVKMASKNDRINQNKKKIYLKNENKKELNNQKNAKLLQKTQNIDKNQLKISKVENKKSKIQNTKTSKKKVQYE